MFLRRDKAADGQCRGRAARIARRARSPCPRRHYVLDAPLEPPFPDGLAAGGVRASGCFWGAERKFWEAPGRVHDRGRLRRRLHAEPDVRRGVQRAHRPHRGRARRVRPGAGQLRRVCCRCSGRATTRRRACARATTSARSTAPASTPTATSSATRPKQSREMFQAQLDEKPATARSRPRSLDAPTFYYAEDYHQQYLAKNPNGYCGLGGTGVSCPIGVAGE